MGNRRGQRLHPSIPLPRICRLTVATPDILAEDGPDVGGAIGKEVRIATRRAVHTQDAVDQLRDRISGTGHVVARVLQNCGARTRC